MDISFWNRITIYFDMIHNTRTTVKLGMSYPDTRITIKDLTVYDKGIIFIRQHNINIRRYRLNKS